MKNIFVLLSTIAWIAAAYPGHASTTLTLTGIQFTGLNSGWAGDVLDDDPNSPYPSEQWTPTASYPVAYVRGNQAPLLYLSFNFSSSESGTMAIKGVGNYGISYDPVTFSFVPGTNTFVQTMNSANALPASVTTMNTLDITWSYSLDGGITWSNLGTSSTVVYILLHAPDNNATLYHSVLNVACAASGATTESQEFSNLWNAFKGPANVTSWQGRSLYYYETGLTFSVSDNPITLYGLLSGSTHSGECYTWQLFLADCLLVHGITDFQLTTVTLTGQNANDAHFLVGNWTKNNQGYGTTPYLWLIQTAQHVTTDFEMYPAPFSTGSYGDLSSTIGYAGQNSSTPQEKIFGNHGILAYNGIYYDPSYGITYLSEADMETNAIYGYSETAWYQSPSDNVETGVRMKTGCCGIQFGNSNPGKVY